jgi:hypothetical protein
MIGAVLALSYVAHAQHAASPFVIDGLGKAAVPVDGAWQFHIGDNPAWASSTLDDSGWESIETGRPWEGQGHRGYTGFAWYRRHLAVAPNSPRNADLTLYLPAVEDACEVYWNGVLVGSYGKVPPYPEWYAFQRPLAETFLLQPAQAGVLALRVWKAPHVYLSAPEEGGVVAVPLVGSAEGVAGVVTAARYRWLQNNLYSLALTLVSTIVAVVALLAWLRHRDRMMLLWLALSMFYPLALLWISIPGLLTFRLAYALIGPAVVIHDIALWFLLLHLLGLYENVRLVRWTRVISIFTLCFAAVDTIAVFTNWTEHYGRLFLIADVASTMPVELCELYGVVLVLFAVRKRLDAARWFLAISALFSELVVASNDFTGLGVRWTHWTLAEKLRSPLFTLAGNDFDIHAIAGALMLIAILYAAWRYSMEWSERQAAIEQEYLSAQELQQVLIPESLPLLPGYAFTSAYRPAQEVGGDFFQIIPLTDGAAMILLGDVSGKGLRAAMTVSLIVGAVRALTRTNCRPAGILQELNVELCGRLQGGFATCLILRLDAEGECTLANAGHPAPFLNGIEVGLPGALPLGMTPQASYEEVQLPLHTGDSLLLYTDGLLEARSPQGELFSFDRLASLLAARPSAEEALQAAQAFGQEDDITVLTLTRLTAGQMSPTQLSVPELAPVS